MQNSNSKVRPEIVYDLDRIDGHDFEGAMVETFRRMGYRTERGKLSNDQGRDIILRKDELLVVVECKHQKAAVGRPVVQKLHSAAITYKASNGLVVTTGLFADFAWEYMAEVNNQLGLKIDLWDYWRLAQEALKVGVFFSSSEHRTNIFFSVPWRAESEVRSFLQTKWLAQIKSAPRTAVESVFLSKVEHEVVPSVLINYRVSKQFTTSVGVIHSVYDSGRRIYGVGASKILPKEEEFWSQSWPKLMPDALNGKKLPTYFGQSIKHLICDVKTGIAQRFSCAVRYRGRNQQNYQKWCEVTPDDVHVETKYVLYGRWRIGLQAGPKKYEANLPDDLARDPTVVATAGFSARDEGFVLGNGVLCNDCGLIAPKAGDEAKTSCETCGRTLCRAHGWTWPALFPKRSPWLCSTCYNSRQRESAEFDVNPALCNYWSSLLLACFPGAPLLLGKRYVLGILVLFLFLCSLEIIAYRRVEPVALVVCSSILWSFYWTSRIRMHNKNLKQLTTYRPEWSE
jgi:restriction system protein